MVPRGRYQIDGDTVFKGDTTVYTHWEQDPFPVSLVVIVLVAAAILVLFAFYVKKTRS